MLFPSVESYMLEKMLFPSVGGYMLANYKMLIPSEGGYMLRNTEAIICFIYFPVKKHRSCNLFHIIFQFSDRSYGSYMI